MRAQFLDPLHNYNLSKIPGRQNAHTAIQGRQRRFKPSLAPTTPNPPPPPLPSSSQSLSSLQQPGGRICRAGLAIRCDAFPTAQRHRDGSGTNQYRLLIRTYARKAASALAMPI